MPKFHTQSEDDHIASVIEFDSGEFEVVLVDGDGTSSMVIENLEQLDTVVTLLTVLLEHKRNEVSEG